MSSDRDVLISMGFGDSRISKALKETNNAGLQPALDWLVSNADKTDEEINNANTTTTATDAPVQEAVPEAKSLKCDECGKLLKSDAEIQAHASRTGHVAFSESVEEIQPLTEEERRNQMEKLQELLKKKKIDREEQEKKESIQRERYRRKMGKEINDAKSKFESDEIKRLADLKKREKEDDRAYREKLKAEIARDREARKTGVSTEQNEVIVKPTVTESKPTTSNYDSCRIQIRHSKGSPIVETFAASDTLFKVAMLYAQKTGCDEYAVEFRSSLPPPKTYGAGDMSKSLKDLGLCPSIVLNAVQKTLS